MAIPAGRAVSVDAGSGRFSPAEGPWWLQFCSRRWRSRSRVSSLQASAPGRASMPGPTAAVVAAARCLVELEAAYHHAEHLVVEIAAVAQPQGLVALHRRDRPLEHVSGRSQLA